MIPVTEFNYNTAKQFIKLNYKNEKLINNLKRAIEYNFLDCTFNNLVILRVRQHYAVAQIHADLLQEGPIKIKLIDEKVIPFDQDRIYPLQKVELLFDWIYPYTN